MRAGLYSKIISERTMDCSVLSLGKHGVMMTFDFRCIAARRSCLLHHKVLLSGAEKSSNTAN